MAKEALYRASSDDSDLRPLKHMTWDQYRNWIQGDEVTTGEPTHYYFWRKAGDDPTTTQPPSIFLHPTPGTGQAGTTKLYLYGYKHPDTIDSAGAGTTVVELEAPYVEAALMYAASLVMRDDGDHVAATSFFSAYRERVELIQAMISRKDTSGPSMMMPKGARTMWASPGDPRGRVG